MSAHGRKQYIAMPLDERAWTVVNRATGEAVYGPLAEDCMTQAEANDLAWAYNRGATDDDEAVHMNCERYGTCPPWLAPDLYPTYLGKLPVNR